MAVLNALVSEALKGRYVADRDRPVMRPAQLVAVDLRQGEYFVLSYSRCKAGYWVLNIFLEQLPDDISDAELGAAVFRAKAASEQDVPNPASREPVPGNVQKIEAAGVRTEGQYIKGAKDVGVEFFDDGNVDIAPHRNAGGKQGFLPITDATGTWHDPDSRTLGKAVRAGFERAE